MPKRSVRSTQVSEEIMLSPILLKQDSQPSEELWELATDEVLCDVNTLQEWYAKHCLYMPPVNVDRLVRHIHCGRDLTQYATRELMPLLLSRDQKEVLAVSGELRKRFSAEQSCQIGDVVVRMQDNEPKPPRRYEYVDSELGQFVDAR